MFENTVTKPRRKAIKQALFGAFEGILLITGLLFCQAVPAMKEPEPLFELTYKSFGQPIFVIKVFDDGKVDYQGNKVKIWDEWRQHVPVLGHRYAQLTREQVEELRTVFLSLPFKELLKYEKKKPAVTWAAVIQY